MTGAARQMPRICHVTRQLQVSCKLFQQLSPLTWCTLRQSLHAVGSAASSVVYQTSRRSLRAVCAAWKALLSCISKNKAGQGYTGQ